MKPRLFRKAADWRAWLEKNHATASEIWIAYYKKGSGKRSVTYREALDEALCYGWIDSTIRRVNGERYMQRYTPRKPGSIWSARNKSHIARLAKAGRMAPPGAAKVEAARRDGSWDRLRAIDPNPETPPDLLAELEMHAGDEALWAKLAPSHKKMYAWWILDAKRPETRSRRIRETVEKLRAGRRPGM
ncbi:MAG: YdeI/OmpD-associated family protein [Candidatus Aminicenantes bacterium]|nr:YdeI/OmpD-associated family protein [Candidatus Aminicenantes bacterium]